MKKFIKLIFTAIFFLVAFVSANAQKISCAESDYSVGGSDTFFLRNAGKLKSLSGKATYPDGTSAPTIIEIYKNQFNRNEKIDHLEINKILDQNDKIIVCKSDANGEFKITGLKDGFYLIRIGTFSNGGFGPENILVEISRKKGKKKKLEIDLGQAI